MPNDPPQRRDEPKSSTNLLAWKLEEDPPPGLLEEIRLEDDPWTLEDRSLDDLAAQVVRERKPSRLPAFLLLLAAMVLVFVFLLASQVIDALTSTSDPETMARSIVEAFTGLGNLFKLILGTGGLFGAARLLLNWNQRSRHSGRRP